MQLLIIAGSITREPVLRRTQAGDPVLSFSLAVDNGKDNNGNRKNSTFYDCSVWGRSSADIQHWGDNQSQGQSSGQRDQGFGGQSGGFGDQQDDQIPW